MLFAYICTATQRLAGAAPSLHINKRGRQLPASCLTIYSEQIPVTCSYGFSEQSLCHHGVSDSLEACDVGACHQVVSQSVALCSLYAVLIDGIHDAV